MINNLMHMDITILCVLTGIRGLDKQRNNSNHKKFQVTNTVEGNFRYQKKRTKPVRRMEDLPLLTLQYYPWGLVIWGDQNKDGRTNSIFKIKRRSYWT